MSDKFFDVSGFAYAHRGLWGGAIPENSLAAFRAAAAAGVGCELDVRVTHDERLVVFHDATLERMCGRPERVDEMTFRDLRMLKLPDGSQIPTLEETLETMNGLPTLVEMKIDAKPGQIEMNRTGVPSLIAAMKFSNAPAAVMSFDEPTVWRLSDTFSIVDRPVGMLIEPDFLDPGASIAKATRAIDCNCTYLAPHFSVLEQIVGQFDNIPRVTWTVRDAEQLGLSRRYGAAPIFEGFSPALAMPSQTPI